MLIEEKTEELSLKSTFSAIFADVMKNVLIVFIALATLTTCTRVPMTGRKQMKLIPASQMQLLSYSNYSTFLRENQLSNNAKYKAMVTNSGKRIQKAVEHI